MTAKALSALTAATSLSATDLLYGKVGSNSRKITPVVLASFLATATLAAGILTASAPLSLTHTWNNAAVTFRGMDIVTTSTASALASTPFRILDGATVLASFGKSNADYSDNNTLSGAYAFAVFGALRSVGNPQYGRYATWMAIGNPGLVTNGAISIDGSWNEGAAFSTINNETMMVQIRSDVNAANILSQAAAAQPHLRGFNSSVVRSLDVLDAGWDWHNAYTSSTNRETAFGRWSSNVFELGVEKGSGGGTARNLLFRMDGTVKLDFGVSASNIWTFGTNVSAPRLDAYRTYTDASNYESLRLYWNATEGTLGTFHAGTGAARTLFLIGAAITLQVEGVANIVTISGQGLIFPNDNSFDIGASGATRPRDYFGGGNLNLAGVAGFGGASSSTTWVNLAAGTTGISQLRFVQGVAPTSPVDGDVWRENNTNTGLKVRINGVTKTVTVS